MGAQRVTPPAGDGSNVAALVDGGGEVHPRAVTRRSGVVEPVGWNPYVVRVDSERVRVDSERGHAPGGSSRMLRAGDLVDL